MFVTIILINFIFIGNMTIADAKNIHIFSRLRQTGKKPITANSPAIVMIKKTIDHVFEYK